jgi:hypothetical protein
MFSKRQGKQAIQFAIQERGGVKIHLLSPRMYLASDVGRVLGHYHGIEKRALERRRGGAPVGRERGGGAPAYEGANLDLVSHHGELVSVAAHDEEAESGDDEAEGNGTTRSSPPTGASSPPVRLCRLRQGTEWR